MSLSQKEMVDVLRIQWKRLWQERAEDKVRAEGIAAADYCDLFLERGTIIHATRDFKSPNFREILKQHQIANADRFIPPSPHIGGWTKFVRMNITNQRFKLKRRVEYYADERKREKQQAKKGGRGWLHK
jgi:hypothetical protein